MKEQDYLLSNISEEITNEKVQGTSRNIKIIILLSFITTLLLVTLFIVILIYLLRDNPVGEINCIYNIKDISNKTSLLGDNFKQLSSLRIYLDDKELNLSKKYKFEKEGEYKIKFKVYDDLNMDYMYQNILELQSVEMRSSKNAKITSMKKTFENCQNMESFNINGFNTENIEDMSFLFSLIKIRTLDLSNLNTNQVTNMSYMFYGSSIERLNVLNFQTNNVIDMSHMFENCRNLRNVDIQNFRTNNVINMNSMFANSSLQDINLTVMNTEKVKDMRGMFKYTNFRRLIFSNFDTSKVTDMSHMFQSCQSMLINIYLLLKLKMYKICHICFKD